MTETNIQNKRKQKRKTKLPFRKSHAFIIGINEYMHLPKLRTAVNDARKIAEVLAQQQGFKVHPPLLDAPYDKINRLLEKTILEKVKLEDRVFFYFAGHGIFSDGEDLPGGYILPADAGHSDKSRFISMQTLHNALNQLPCRHLLLVLDCCNAGTFRWASRYRYGGGYMPKRIFKERFDRFVKDPAWQVITSSAYDQGALDVLHEKVIGKRDDETMFHSPFAEALFKGLEGAADIIPTDGGDGLITASELYLYLRQQVEPKTIDADERRRQTPGIFPMPRHDKGEYIFLHPLHRFNLDLPSLPNIRNPYKGLQAFEEGDKDLFYGRERVIEELKQKVTENNLIVVTGVSGTGKSSVVKAGLIPELRKQGYNVLPVLRPGKTPTTSLENAINKSKIFDAEISIPGNMNAIMKKLMDEKNALVIDQFEELFTQCKEEKERDNFFADLKKFLDHNKRSLLKIILTVRADFEPQFKGTVLEEYWHPGRYTVPPFTTEELREIIVKPTVQEIFYIEPTELVDRIINEVIQAPGALPLLSFALSELYSMYTKSGRTDRVLHEEDYKKLGGVIGALHTCADDLYYKLDAQHQITMRKIMLRMVSIEGSELAGKRVSLKALDFSEDENSRVKVILDKLLEARLILQNKDEDNQAYVEPAHDALIRSWPTLDEWIKKHKKENILLQDRLSESVKDYAAINNKGLLWNNDPRLEMVKAELHSPNSWLNKQEAKFIDESIRLKKRRKNRLWTITVSVIIILSALSIFSFLKATEAGREARIAQANYLASQAQLKLNDDPTIAIRLAEAAYYLDESPNVMQVLSAAAATTFDHPFYNLNIRHDRPVNKAAFFPDGNGILTFSSDNTAKLWDLKGKHLNTLQHNNVVYNGSFSPNGTQILTVSADNSATLWDWQGKVLKTMAHKAAVTSAVFSPDGRWILTASDDHTVKLWDILKGNEPLKTYWHYLQMNAAIFSPDGNRILAIANNNTAILWDWQNTNPEYKQLGDIIAAEFSPTGKHIAGITNEYSIKVWDSDGNPLRSYKEGVRNPTMVSFTPDGTEIFIADLDGSVKLLDLHGKIIRQFDRHKEQITSLEFSPDGAHLLTASADKTAILWDMKGNVLENMDKHSDRINSAVFSPDGTKILTASSDGTAKLWDLKEQPTRELNQQRFPVIKAVFSPNGKKVLVVSNDQTVQLLDLYGNVDDSFNFKAHDKLINSAVFSPDGRTVLTASEDGTAKLWDLHGKKLLTLDSHAKGVNWAEFSPDGQMILTASDDNTAKLWNLQGKESLSLNGHTKGLNRAVFSPDGTKILTASQDGTAKTWNLEGKQLGNCNRHSWGVDIALFSPDSTKVLTVSTVARLWNIKGELITEYARYTGSIKSAVFSPDGTKLLTASDKKTAKVWDLEGNAIIELFGHENVVYSARFSPDGQRILTASADRTVKLWDLQGNLLTNFDKHKGIVNSAEFSPDGNRVLSVSSDFTVMLWLTPHALIKWLKTSSIPKLKNMDINFNEVEENINKK